VGESMSNQGRVVGSQVPVPHLVPQKERPLKKPSQIGEMGDLHE
jgi:hypothetical protein